MKHHKTLTEKSADLLSEDQLWGTPRISDVAFLVSVRSRINCQKSGLWLSSQRTFAMAGTATVLLAGVWLPGSHRGQTVPEQAAVPTLNSTVEEFVTEDADPLELANYLGIEAAISDTASAQLESPPESDQPVSVEEVTTDEILELDEQEFDLVIAEIQETEFF